MQPQELVKNLQDIQMATNKISITSAGLGHAIGNTLKFLGSDEDLTNMPGYVAQLGPCINALTDALNDYIEAVTRFHGGGHRE